MRLIAWLVLCLTLSSCQSLTLLMSPPSLDKYAPQRILRLIKPIPIPENQLRIYFQNGEIVQQQAINLFQAHCELEIKLHIPKNSSISADEFEIIGVHIEKEKMPRATSHENNTQNAIQLSTTQLYLQPKSGAEAFRLNCTIASDAYSSGLVELDEFNKITGGYFEFN